MILREKKKTYIKIKLHSNICCVLLWYTLGIWLVNQCSLYNNISLKVLKISNVLDMFPVNSLLLAFGSMEVHSSTGKRFKHGERAFWNYLSSCKALVCCFFFLISTIKSKRGFHFILEHFSVQPVIWWKRYLLYSIKAWEIQSLHTGL